MGNPTVSLISYTPDPIGTLWRIWEASKTENPWEHIRDANASTKFDVEADRLFIAVIKQKIPVAAMIHFTFLLENISISLREQLVRHKIGAIVDDRVGMDTVPDLAESNYWSQSHRITDMTHFAQKGSYRVPPIVREWETSDDEELLRLASEWHDRMHYTAAYYARCVNAGMPMEDAREMIPLGTQHRIVWDVNLRTLQNIFGERGCWILQGGLWHPIITGMVNEMAEQVHPLFRQMVTPPCFAMCSDKFAGCAYVEENRRRVTGEDAMPLCPLYLNNHMHVGEQEEFLAREDDAMISLRSSRTESYRHFWGRDPRTGKITGG